MEVTVIQPMTADEAQVAIETIHKNQDSTELLLFELYEREGWKALGYRSMHQCIKSEFANTSLDGSTLYKKLQAGRTRSNIKVLPTGSISDRALRPISTNEFVDKPEVQREIINIAIDEAKSNHRAVPTTADIKQAKQIYQQKPKPEKKSVFNRTNENIEWAAWSWNPVTGCLHGCDYCYARDIANRFYPQGFEPIYHPGRLDAPVNTRLIQPRWKDDTGHDGVFVCSMADLFGKWVPAEWIESVLQSVSDNPQWEFLFLTKFPIRMAEFTYPPNAWLGTTVDKQWAVDRAEKAFGKIKTSGFNGICWLSCEPMLERLTFSSLEMFDWVVMGGASRSSQTPEYKPPFDDINHLYNQARKDSLMVYQKTNLIPGMSDDQRVREYPVRRRVKEGVQ